MVGAARAKMLFGLPEAAAIRRIVLPAFFGMGRRAIRAVTAFALAFWAFADIGFKIRVIVLWIVPHQASIDATGIAFHVPIPAFVLRASMSAKMRF